MLYLGLNILPRSGFWSANFNGRSDNLDVIRLIYQSGSIMHLLYLNRVAQHLIEDAEALASFQCLTIEQRAKTIQSLGIMTQQAHPTLAEATAAIDAGGLKKTFTPCRMLLNDNLDSQTTRLWQLPNSELDKSFILLINLYRIADKRRRVECGDECNHWWHQDLTDEDVMQ